MTTRSRIIRWLVVLLWIMIILAVSSIPNLPDKLPASWSKGIIPSIPDDLKGYEIVAAFTHFGEFLILAFVLSWAVVGRSEAKIVKLLVFSLSILYAFYDEIYQDGIPGRGFQVSDLTFDTLGVLAGMYLYQMIHSRHKKKEEGL